ncbi:DUF6691 family protein [Roseinatronobacter alkalisoli]|uniref:YeeE/YedE family protein n=1 Tax=Roseinatronobacter alkalisoli TaxID=3028235 RepID=A0ABT5TDX8_9RHOB|nr:DUF6691 family protein [Roseinatronobacter sp. HJB301]MDD7973327.1 hypothetical protein [Roseinatronobacter sp. HJB301]
MQRIILAAASGGLFGAGLLVSGMTDTTKVQGWLDIFGAWDPTLAFVLGGAILPMLLAWNMTTRRAQSLVGQPFPARPDPRLGHNLVVGSVLFGAGWGLVGLCPGPAIASLSWGGTGGIVFILAMIGGMVIAKPIRVRIDKLAAY